MSNLNYFVMADYQTLLGTALISFIVVEILKRILIPSKEPITWAFLTTVFIWLGLVFTLGIFHMSVWGVILVGVAYAANNFYFAKQRTCSKIKMIGISCVSVAASLAVFFV